MVPKTNSWRRNTSRNDCQWTQFITPSIPGAQLHSRRVGCWTGLPAVLIFHQWKHLEHHETRSRTKKSQDCWAAKTLHQTRMEQHPPPKKSKSCCPQFRDIYRKMLKGEAVQEHYKVTLLMCVWFSVFERIWVYEIHKSMDSVFICFKQHHYFEVVTCGHGKNTFTSNISKVLKVGQERRIHSRSAALSLVSCFTVNVVAGFH